MCGRYIVVSKVKTIGQRFNVRVENVDPVQVQMNIGVGMQGFVITGEMPDNLQTMTFGLTPSWATKPMYLFNARSEGDHNKEDDMHYKGAAGIITKPAFRQAIRQRRCLVIADAFLEGSKEDGLSKPWLIYMRNKQRPFAMAGIWETWHNTSTNTTHHGYAIITAPSSDITAAIGHHRSPVILQKEQERTWLDPRTELSEITSMLHAVQSGLMNAYPVSALLKNAQGQDIELLQPIGETIVDESQIKIERHIHLFGMGESRSADRRKSLDKNEESGATP